MEAVILVGATQNFEFLHMPIRRKGSMNPTPSCYSKTTLACLHLERTSLHGVEV